MSGHKVYIFLISLVFVGFVVLFTALPRSTYSNYEMRELATFPEYSSRSLADASFTKKVSEWFSDSEPYRDHFMAFSMMLKYAMAIRPQGEDNVTFHPATEKEKPAEKVNTPSEENDGRHVDEYKNKLTVDDVAKIADAGIIIIGKGKNVRALMAFGGEASGGTSYAEAANRYKKEFPSANVYCMVAPIAVDFYCPDKVKKSTKMQLPVINNIHSHLSKDVKPVDVYTPLGNHASEPIYLRTDHHWSPLGAYYAAEKFAQVAKVPFKNLSNYDKHVVHDFVGSMYGYSKDVSVKKAPEDFIYYTPRDVEYTTTYIDYKVGKSFHIESESKPIKDKYFYKFRDGSSSAYCTFMGSDKRLTHVKTSTNNGRRLLVLKDSYGNAIPGYLFYSFEDIHVVDFRYFNKNMRKYIADNKITDILFANNTFNAYSPKTRDAYIRFLDQ